MSLKPGDLVRVSPRGPEVLSLSLALDLPSEEVVYIVEEVVLDTDPLGPTGHLTVVILDPRNGERYGVDGNRLEKI